MTNAAWIRIFNTHTGGLPPPPDCTDLYLMLATRVVALIVFPNPAIAAQFHNALDGQRDGKVPPDLVEKKRLSHPIEWSIKKSTREGIGSCKVATLGSIHCWTWCPGPARKGGMVFQPSCLLSPEPAGTLHTTVGSQSPDTNLGAVKLSALAQLLGCSFPVTSKAGSRPPVSLNNWVPGVDRGGITCFVTSLQIPHGAPAKRGTPRGTLNAP